MSKAWTNSRWTLNWEGQRTHYKYKLVITPSDTTDITATDITLPEDCLLDYEYSWEYDKYPLGMTNAQAWEFTFAIDLCPVDFAKALFDPYADFTLTENSTTLKEYTVGNLFQVYVSYDNGNNYYLVYTGLQRNGDDIEFDFNESTCRIDTVDLGFYILSTLPYRDWETR